MGYSLRKRRRSDGNNHHPDVLAIIKAVGRVLVITGSGISKDSGLSTFSSPNGLYEQARKQLKLASGDQVFSYRFFHQQPTQAMSVFAKIAAQALKAKPGPAHDALAALCRGGHLQRHFTLNVDGLVEAAGVPTCPPSTWATLAAPDTVAGAACSYSEAGLAQADSQGAADVSTTTMVAAKNKRASMVPSNVPHHPRLVDQAASKCACGGSLNCVEGGTVELHGRVTRLLCTTCKHVSTVTTGHVQALRSGKHVLCPHECGPLRFGMLLYDDEDAALITPTSALTLLQHDASKADMIVWAGISFHQSASVGYFETVLSALEVAGKLARVPQVILNPDTEAYFNLQAVRNERAMSDAVVVPWVEDASKGLTTIAQRFHEGNA